MARPLSANASARKVRRAKTRFSGGPWRSTIMRSWPAEKVTDVSDGGGPDVSRTMTRERGRIRAAVGTGALVLLETGARPPHAVTPANSAVQVTVACRLVRWDIAGQPGKR